MVLRGLYLHRSRTSQITTENLITERTSNGKPLHARPHGRRCLVVLQIRQTNRQPKRLQRRPQLEKTELTITGHRTTKHKGGSSITGGPPGRFFLAISKRPIVRYQGASSGSRKRKTARSLTSQPSVPVKEHPERLSPLAPGPFWTPISTKNNPMPTSGG